MTVANITRKAGPYTWSQGSSYPFNFKVFQASDVSVYTLTNGTETRLTSGYTVTINADQNNNPGGSVIVSGSCGTVTIISNVDYTQEARFTNRGGFYPETLNECYDKLTILCQQLKESVDRSVKVPVTSTETEATLLNRLLNLAEQASEFKDQAEEIKNNVQSLVSPVIAISDDIETVSDISNKVTTVADNISSVVTDANNIDSIKTVANDITGVGGAYLDMGYVNDAVETVSIPTGGYLVNVYNMRSNIQTVVDNIDSILAAVASIQEIESVNYEQVAEDA